MSFVAVDLGASCTRYVSDNGKFSTIPNNVQFIENYKSDNMIMDPTPVDISVTGNSITDALELIINHPEEKSIEGVDSMFPMHALMGYIADSFSSNNIRPSVGTNKYNQRINYLSAIAAVTISKLKYNIDNDVTLYLAIPPSELKKAKEVMHDKLIGCYEVTLPKYNNGVVVKFNITDVKCYAESAMAITSYFYNIDGSDNEEHLKYASSTLLSLDIGASTTDLAIVKNGRILDKTGYSCKFGGNNTREMVNNKIYAEIGLRLPPEDADEAVAEGRMKFGNTYKDISDIVNEAKMDTARKIVNDIDAYFGNSGVPLQTINAIIVSGGGSMRSQYINEDKEVVYTSKPMSEFITVALQSRCPGVAVESHSDNPRFANIYGLFLRAYYNNNK